MGSAVPSRGSLLILHTQAESGAYSRESSPFPRRRPFIYLNHHTPSGQSRVYRVTQLLTDGVHCRESAGTGSVVLKVLPVTGGAFAQVARTCILRADVVLSFSGVTFVLFSSSLFSLKPQPFVQSFFVLRYACAPTVTRSFNGLRSFFVFVSLELSLFPSIFVPITVFSLCVMERRLYVFPFRVVFFYLVTTGWIFDISLC